MPSTLPATVALFILAADINGSWAAERPGPGGQTTDTQFNFTQTGAIPSTMGEQKSVNRSTDGDAPVFPSRDHRER